MERRFEAPRRECSVRRISSLACTRRTCIYWPDTPKLQFLHCLANSCEGGESLFSDGVKAAQEVKRLDQSAYTRLTQKNTPYHYNKDGNHYYRELAIVPTEADAETNGNQLVPSVPGVFRDPRGG